METNINENNTIRESILKQVEQMTEVENPPRGLNEAEYNIWVTKARRLLVEKVAKTLSEDPRFNEPGKLKEIADALNKTNNDVKKEKK